MTDINPIPACLSHLTQRDSDVSKPKPYRNAPTHNVWRGMLNRCRNPSHPNWKSYGGRGITVCERWKVFSNFLKDMGERPHGMQIDRRDNDGGYTPENCVWVTRLQQAQNRRNNLAVFVDGEKMSANEATRRYNIPSTAIYRMMKIRKMTPTEAVLYYKKNRQTGIGRSFLTPAKLTSDEALAVRARALEEAARIARNGCLVPPDGGSPTEAEADMCDNIATAIRALLPTPPTPAPDEARGPHNACGAGSCDQPDRCASEGECHYTKSPFYQPSRAAPDEATSYQARVHRWILHCFGPEIGADKVERNHRFLEESLELVQSGGCTASEAHQLVDYVFGRPVGEMLQEVGGVMNTLAALCNAHGVDLDAAAEAELTRVWGKSEQIRAKQAAKPKHSPLPQSAPDEAAIRAELVATLRQAHDVIISTSPWAIKTIDKINAALAKAAP